MKVRHLIFAAMATFALASCNKDDDSATPVVSQFPEDGVMRFTTNLVDPATVLTRASVTSSDVNVTGQQFQVKIVNPSSATYSYFNTVQYDGSEWTPINRMLWQNDQQSITVTAAYKQGKAFSDNEFVNGANLTVAADQSTEAKLKQQDLDRKSVV